MRNFSYLGWLRGLEATYTEHNSIANEKLENGSKSRARNRLDLQLRELLKAAIIWDLEDPDVRCVIVGVGGFLGVGEKNVAVPFQAVKVTEKDGKRYLVLDTTKESAPGYTFDHGKNVWIPATKQG